MRRIPGIILCSLALIAPASAQSGRRFDQPEPAAKTETEPEKLPDFSESTPQPKRPKAPAAMRKAAENRSPAQSSVKTAPQDAPTSADGELVLKVETNLVTIPVSVIDRNGIYVPGLSQSDFKIYEDGKEQAITYFGSTDKPFTVVLLLDTSPSTAYRIEEIQNAALAFIDQLKPQDKVMVVEFDGNIHVLTEATNDRARLTNAVKRADFGYGTSLYDSVNFAIKKRLIGVEGRKAIVLFTDGVDTSSGKAGYDSTLDLAEESDALIFPIYYNTFEANRDGVFSPRPGEEIMMQPSTPEEYALGAKYLYELAAYTGGRVFRPESTPNGLKSAFEGIAEELRRQYNLGYIPADDGTPGQRKSIKVRVDRPNLVIRSRDSYIVGSNVPQKPSAPPAKR
ncbi:MAG: VWA domain-containing protein [Acidobacteriota bacterium]